MSKDIITTSEIKELDIFDPKYIPLDMLNQSVSSLYDNLAKLSFMVFLKPNDPWMLINDELIQLPFPTNGKGLSMNVCASYMLKALECVAIKNQSTDKLNIKPIKHCSDQDLKSAEDFSNMPYFTISLSDVMTHLKLGAYVLSDGSVYIGKREELILNDLPALDDSYRLVLNPYKDESLFTSNVIIDEWGNKRQAYNESLAIRSLSFSKAAYNMRIKPFITDGWIDYTLIYEGKIQSKADYWNLEPSTGNKILSSVKQLMLSQSTKAVVMARPLSNNQAIINITFTGTKHAPDWLNNFKVSVSNHLHKGFYELAVQFDSLINQITLPHLAKTFGRENLTLSEVFEEAKKPNSQFKIWITGHSQGGSLTQVYIAEFLCKRGVLHENIFGYSFASPSVATSKYCENPGNFPIYNINNCDDFACRVGSALRLGMDLMYFPDDEFRRNNYPGYNDPKHKGLFDDILKLCYWMTDSFKFGEFMIALMTFAPQSPVAKNFVDWIEENPILNKIYKKLTINADLSKSIHDRMLKMLEKPYKDVGGVLPKEEHIEKVSSYLKVLFEKWGIDCFAEYTKATHQIPNNYSSIVQKPYSDFRRGIWTVQNKPKLLSPDGTDLMSQIPFPEIEA